MRFCGFIHWHRMSACGMWLSNSTNFIPPELLPEEILSLIRFGHCCCCVFSNEFFSSFHDYGNFCSIEMNFHNLSFEFLFIGNSALWMNWIIFDVWNSWVFIKSAHALCITSWIKFHFDSCGDWWAFLKSIWNLDSSKIQWIQPAQVKNDSTLCK